MQIKINNVKMKLLLISTLLFFSAKSYSTLLYTEFSVQQYDNEKPNGFIEHWILDCDSQVKCNLNTVAFMCEKKKTKPFLDFIEIYNIKIENNEKNVKSVKKITFEFSQPYGPKDIKCVIKFSDKVTVVAEAECIGHGTWSAGTKYKRVWSLIKGGPFLLKDKCKSEIELP